jgi:hypothetical protein
MTPEQEEKFDALGCVCRSLLALANLKGAKLTKTEFLDKYPPKFWSDIAYGSNLNAKQLRQLLKDLALANDFKRTADYGDVRAHIKNGSLKGLLLLTEKGYDANKNEFHEYHHCTLVNEKELKGEDFICFEKLDVDAGQHTKVPYSEQFLKQLDAKFVLLL